MSGRVSGESSVVKTQLQPATKSGNILEDMMKDALISIVMGEHSPSINEGQLNARGKFLLVALYGNLAFYTRTYNSPLSQADADGYKGNVTGFLAFVKLMSEFSDKVKTELKATSMQSQETSVRNFLSPYFAKVIIDYEQKYGDRMNFPVPAGSNMIEIRGHIDQILGNI